MTLSDITPHSDIACTCAVDQVANNTRTYALFSQKCHIFSPNLFIAFQLKASKFFIGEIKMFRPRKGSICVWLRMAII